MAARFPTSTLPLLALALLSCPTPALGQGSAVPASPETIEAQELLWSYNRSPPVYPSPEANGTGDWAAAYAYATSLVAQMTNDEKQNLTFGFSTTTNGCSGISGSALRVGFPGLCLNDGPAGLRGTELVSGFASGVHVAASWNRDLAKARGVAIGQESKAKGVNVWLGPVMGPLGRTVLGGRNWEGFSVDPYLCGILNADTVLGVQQNAIVSAKHYIGNEQETNRNPSTTTGNASVSSNIDDRTMHELYLWPFQDVVKAGAGSVMCSYNKINGSYGCQNSKAQNGLLKGELGFQGFIVSDWGAQHAGIASADAGLDMAMPNSDYWDGNLTIAVDNGTFAQSRLDDMAKRIVATWYKLAHFEPGTGVPYDLLSPHEDQIVTALSPDSKDTIFQGAVEGHVLVKNVNNALPLKSPKILSLYGYDGLAPTTVNPGSGFSKWTLGFNSINISDADVLTFFSGNLTDSDLPQAAYGGTLISGGGSGAATPPYISAPFDAFAQRAYADSTQLFWDFTSQDPAYEAGSDACFVFINAFATEGFDRTALTDPWSDTLVANVAAKCPNTIVVLHNAGIRLVDAWIEHPNVTAVVYAHLPGQDSGRALVELVYGDATPSGKLPYTVAKTEADYGSLLEPVRADNVSNYYTQANFTEGLYLDYRYFEARNITPRFPFGFGLSYTSFEYSALDAQWSVAAPPEAAPAGAIVEGGLESLWETVATVTATVTNTGDYRGAEVVQLYVGIPYADTPAKQLRGFAKVPLEVGASEEVTFALTRRDLSVWDVESQGWVLPRGTYQVYVSASVEDVKLTGSLVVG